VGGVACQEIVHSRLYCGADDIFAPQICIIAYLRFIRSFFLSIALVCRCIICLLVIVGPYLLVYVQSTCVSFAVSACCVFNFTLVIVTAFNLSVLFR